MLKNYLKIAFRNLWKRKVVASINITGLTLGLLVTLLIFLYLRYEFSYDRYLPGWMFLLAAVLAIGIALLTVGFQSVKAALTDPVISLRTE